MRTHRSDPNSSSSARHRSRGSSTSSDHDSDFVEERVRVDPREAFDQVQIRAGLATKDGRFTEEVGGFDDECVAVPMATLRLIFHLPLRQAEGFLNSLFGMMGIDRSAPDHTTLSRRSQHLDLTLRGVPTDERLHLIVDSTGLSIVGEGEWAAVKHGPTRRATAGRRRKRTLTEGLLENQQTKQLES